jgi:glycosyltransferase involved in cell wall biosynthesis
MRIGLVAPPWVAVPPTRYGGTESVVDNLARGLADRGHTVRLFTVGSSTCPVDRRWLFDEPVGPIGAGELEAAHVLAAYESLAPDVDVIHDHTALGPLLAQALPGEGPDGDGPRVPVVVTLHGPPNRAPGELLGHTARRAAVVAISRSQRAAAAGLRVARVIHHGIDVDLHHAGPGGGGFVMFVGRMSPDKGVHRAVDIARRAGTKLVIAAKMWEDVEVEYFRTQVEPRLHDGVEVLLDADRETRIDLLGRADALLNPICWPEPFGLVMAESLACGTPVVGAPYGAAPEIVADGVTGFLRESDDDLVEALARVGELDREACRLAAVERFSIERMARDHEQLYAELVAAATLPRRDAARRLPARVRAARGSLGVAGGA